MPVIKDIKFGSNQVKKALRGLGLFFEKINPIEEPPAPDYAMGAESYPSQASFDSFTIDRNYYNYGYLVRNNATTGTKELFVLKTNVVYEGFVFTSNIDSSLITIKTIVNGGVLSYLRPDGTTGANASGYNFGNLANTTPTHGHYAF